MTTEVAVSALMSTPVVSITRAARVADVLQLADERSAHHFPIVEQERLLGIVCTCNLEDRDPSEPAYGSAWHHVITLPPDSPVSEAARLMMLHGVGSIVVVDAAGVRGIVTRDDVARSSAEAEAQLAQYRCTLCGSRHHLGPNDVGQCLCQTCRQRENA